MAIVAPDNIGFTALGGSSISTRDTYVKPAAVQADQTLGQLADAAGKMGVKVTALAGQQSANAEDLEKQKTDYYVGQVRGSIKEGLAKDAQVGALLPQLVPSQRAIVSGKLGAEAGEAFIRSKTEAIRSDPRALSSPEWAQAQIRQLKIDAASMVKDDPFYGNGFMKAVNEYGDGITHEVDQKAAGWYDEQGREHIANEARAGHTAAAGSATQYKTVADTPDQDFSALKAVTTNKRTDTIDGLNVEYASKLQSMVTAAQAAGVKVGIFSGYRSEAKQAELYNKKVGDLMDQGQTKDQAMRGARRWVAPPGQSNHNHGEAVDLDYGGKAAKEWVHANAEKYGLYFPMAHEPWHIEMIGGRRQSTKGPVRPDQADTGEPTADEPISIDLSKHPGVGYDVNAHIAQVESGNNPAAQNPNSSAGGLGQFIDSTFLDVARTANPALRNATDAEVLALKKDTSPEGIAFQKQVLATFTDQNGKALGKAGVNATPGNLYAAHTLGVDKAIKVLSAADNVPLKQLIGAKAMAVNPQWAGFTVAEYKQWANAKMGGPVSAAVAGQNAIRKVDYVSSKTLSVPDMVRRDIYSKTLLADAVAAGDASILDRMPPEYMSQEVQNSFAIARKQIADYNFGQDQRARQIEAQKRDDEFREGQIKLNDDLVQGKPVDLKQYMGADPRLFKAAQDAMNKDLTVNPDEAIATRINLLSGIEAASASGDWSKVNPAWKGDPGTNAIQKFILDHPGLNHTETKTMLDGLSKARDVGSATRDPDSVDYFNTHLKTFTDQLTMDDKSFAASQEGKIAGLEGNSPPPIVWSAEARQAYDLTVRMGYKSAIAATGQKPTDMTPIYEKAYTAAVNHLKLLQDSRKAAMDATQKGKPASTNSMLGQSTPDQEATLKSEEKPTEWVQIKPGVYVVKGSPDDHTAKETDPASKASTKGSPIVPEVDPNKPKEGDTFKTEKGTTLKFKDGNWQSPVVPLPPPVKKAPAPPPKEEPKQVLRPRPSSKELQGPSSGDIRQKDGRTEVYKLITIGRSSRYEWVPQ